MTHKFYSVEDENYKRFNQTMSFIDYILKRILKDVQSDPQLRGLTMDQLKKGIKDIKIEQSKLIIKFDEDKLACMIGSPLHVTDFTINRKDNNVQEIDDQ